MRMDRKCLYVISQGNNIGSWCSLVTKHQHKQHMSKTHKTTNECKVRFVKIKIMLIVVERDETCIT
jgi:ribosomal protein S4E